MMQQVAVAQGGAASSTQPAPPSRTLASSAFLRLLSDPDSAPRFHHALEAAVHGVIREHARRAGLRTADADAFFSKLRANALRAALGAADGDSELLQPSQLMFVAVRLWTSAAKLGGREFCSILNEALRDDTPPAVDHAVTITHALNAFCVTRRVEDGPVRWPAAHVTYRGTALPRQHRAFFFAGQRYRAPMFLATAEEEDTSINSFLMRLPPATADQAPPFQEPTLWRFHLDGALPEKRRCVHLNFIDRTDGTVHGEDEFLYAPYSVFTVRATRWHPTPLVNAYVEHYHEIDVDVAPDNKRAPLDLPLAPWC